MGSLSLLQRIFPTQELNGGLLHCRWILYQLSYQGLHLCYCQVTSVVSNSVQPHRWQPTRLPHPWDSPGKNTGVGCHFLLQGMKVKSESEVAHCSLPGRPWDFPGKSTGMRCHYLLQTACLFYASSILFC